MAVTREEGTGGLPDPEAVDFFTDPLVMVDSDRYYEAIRAKGVVWQEPHHGAFIVTGYEEICAIYRDPDTYSSCNSFAGPFVEIPETPEDPDDYGALIERFRRTFPNSENFITFDGDEHAAHRGLMMRLLTPRRLKENEDFMARASDDIISRFVHAGECEFATEYAQPYSLAVIADLLGIPEQDQEVLKDKLVQAGPAGKLDSAPKGNFLWYLEEFFEPYIEDRRNHPRDDVLTAMALARFPDGSTPSVNDVVQVATILFAGGQGTSARYQIAMMKLLAENRQLQDRLRADRSVVPNLIEEVLRLKSPTKINHRMARRSTQLGGVRIPAGSTIVMVLAAADRDPEHFLRADEFWPERANAREHLAFGRGAHSCPGAPLVRAEAKVTIDRILDRMADIEISEVHHGPSGARQFRYTPSYITQGVEELHIRFTPC
jgi:cytochrome P450